MGTRKRRNTASNAQHVRQAERWEQSLPLEGCATSRLVLESTTGPEPVNYVSFLISAVSFIEPLSKTDQGQNLGIFVVIVWDFKRVGTHFGREVKF